MSLLAMTRREGYRDDDFLKLNQNKNSNPGTAKNVEKMKNSYQPRVSANIPEDEVSVLRASEARDDKIAY